MRPRVSLAQEGGVHSLTHSFITRSSPSIDWGTTRPPEGPRCTAALSEQARGLWLSCVVCAGAGGEWRPAGVSERLGGRPGTPRRPDAAGRACRLRGDASLPPGLVCPPRASTAGDPDSKARSEPQGVFPLNVTPASPPKRTLPTSPPIRRACPWGAGAIQINGSHDQQLPLLGYFLLPSTGVFLRQPLHRGWADNTWNHKLVEENESGTCELSAPFHGDCLHRPPEGCLWSGAKETRRVLRPKLP